MSNLSKLPTPPVLTLVEIKALTKRVNADEPGAIAELHRHLRNPADIDRFGGNLTIDATIELSRHAGRDSRRTRFALHAKLRHLRDRLIRPDDSPSVHLLAERAALCWLHVTLLEIEAGLQESDAGRRAVAVLLDRAHRRYLTALKTLAAIRRLEIPVIQVNVAREQQIVMVGGGGGADIDV